MDRALWVNDQETYSFLVQSCPEKIMLCLTVCSIVQSHHYQTIVLPPIEMRKPYKKKVEPSLVCLTVSLVQIGKNVLRKIVNICFHLCLCKMGRQLM